jgi:hypothetical protein
MSAAFHMAQRTGVILSGDYSAPQLGSEITSWPVGTYGILEDGSIIRKAKSGYDYWESPEYKKTSLTDYNTNIPLVGHRYKYADALPLAKARYERFKTPTSTSATLTVQSGTWNDGAYTYVVKSATEVYVPETGKTFMSSSDTWGKFVAALNSATLKKGKAPAKSSGGGAALAPVNSPALVETSTPFYKAKWFLPVVGVSTVGIVLVVALWPSSKKAEVAV